MLAISASIGGAVQESWDTSGMAVIIQKMMNQEYSDTDIAEIMGGNMLRALLAGCCRNRDVQKLLGW